MSVDLEKKVPPAEIQRFLDSGGAADYFAAISPSLLNTTNLLLIVLLIIGAIYGPPVAQQFLDNLNNPRSVDIQAWQGAPQVIDVNPVGKFKQVNWESIPADAPVRRMMQQLIPPGSLQIYFNNGPEVTENPLSGAYIFVDTRAGLSIKDLIYLMQHWLDVRNNHTLPRTTINYRNVQIEYTRADAIKNAVSQLPRVDNSSELRQVDHPKGARVITPEDAALLVSAGNDVARSLVDVLTKNGVDVRGLTIGSIGSVAEGDAQFDRANNLVSDVDHAIEISDPALFRQIKSVLDDPIVAAQMEGQVARIFESKGIPIPYGNHLVLILVNAAGRVIDVTDVALGLLNPK